jgi:hypothetical protein
MQTAKVTFPGLAYEFNAYLSDDGDRLLQTKEVAEAIGADAGELAAILASYQSQNPRVVLDLLPLDLAMDYWMEMAREGNEIAQSMMIEGSKESLALLELNQAELAAVYAALTADDSAGLDQALSQIFEARES